MATQPIENRLTDIETRFAELDNRVAQLSARVDKTSTPEAPWWKRIVGIYANDSAFDEAERLGREWRESDRPPTEEESAS